MKKMGAQELINLSRTKVKDNKCSASLLRERERENRDLEVFTVLRCTSNKDRYLIFDSG